MNRVWISGSPVRFRVSPPGVDVKTSSPLENLIDERLGAVSSISGFVAIARRQFANSGLPLPFSTTVMFGRTFPSPPAFVFTMQNLQHNAWVYGLRPLTQSGQAGWSCEARVYTDRVIFDNYNGYYYPHDYPTDEVYWRAFI